MVGLITPSFILRSFELATWRTGPTYRNILLKSYIFDRFENHTCSWTKVKKPYCNVYSCFSNFYDYSHSLGYSRVYPKNRFIWKRDGSSIHCSLEIMHELFLITTKNNNYKIYLYNLRNYWLRHNEIIKDSLINATRL